MHPIESKIALLKAKMIAVLRFNLQDNAYRTLRSQSNRTFKSKNNRVFKHKLTR